MKHIILLLGCLFFAVGAHAQLTLDVCRTLARNHYPEIRQYDLVRQTEQYSLSNARRAWLPQVAFSAQATWQTAVPSFPEVLTGMLSQQGIAMPGLTKDQYKVQLELNQTVWDGGKSVADKQVARAESAAEARATDVELYALEGRVDELYFGILLLDERVAQATLTYELLQRNLDQVQILQRHGVATQADADAVEAESLTVKQQLTQVEASRGVYRQMLALFIDQSLEGVTLVRPDVVEPVVAELQRPELAMFDSRVDAFAAQARQLRSASRPRFGLFAQGYYGYPGLDFMASMLKNSWSWNALLGVRMSWNFGAYYTQRNSLAKLRVAQQRVDVQRDLFLFNTQLQTVQQSGEIERLRKALADDDRIVALRRAVREAAESKLRQGVIDTYDLLRTITDEAAAKTSRAAREVELQKTICELKHTVNR